MIDRVERLLLTVWVGCLWAVGLLVAPTLFRVLDDRKLAGTVAGDLFSQVAIIGLVCGIALLVIAYTQNYRPQKEWRVWLIVVMIALTVISRFVLQPMIVDLRSQGIVPGSDIAKTFGMLHGISSALYMANCVMGAVLVVMGLRRGR